MDKLETSSEEEQEDEEETEKKATHSKSKGKTRLKGPTRRKRPYIEIEYEEETEPASKTKVSWLSPELAFFAEWQHHVSTRTPAAFTTLNRIIKNCFFNIVAG